MKKQKKVKKSTRKKSASLKSQAVALRRSLKLIAIFLFVLSSLPLKAIEGRLLITTSPNFFDRWYKSYNPLPLAHIPQTQHIYKRQVFYMLPVITGFSTHQGKANIAYNITVQRGDEILFNKKSVTGLKKQVFDTTGIYLSETILNYEFAKKSKNGEYTITAEVIDFTSNDTVVLTNTITVGDYVFNERKITTADTFFLWQNYYYEGTEPDREIDGLMFFSFPQMQSNSEKTLSLLAYFAEVFKDKKYLQYELENVFSSRNEDERRTIIHVLNLVGYMPQSLQSKFTAKEKKYFADLKGYGLPYIPKEGIQNHILLNMQLARFFATGNYEYAKSVAETFKLAKYKGTLTKFNEPELLTDENRQEAFLETVYQKNKEQLLGLLPNHPLFNGYCLFMIKTNDVSDIVKQELEAVIVQ